MSTSLLDLPDDILLLLLSHRSLTLRDIAHCAAACRTLHSLYKDEHLWRLLLHSRYPAAPSATAAAAAGVSSALARPTSEEDSDSVYAAVGAPFYNHASEFGASDSRTHVTDDDEERRLYAAFRVLYSNFLRSARGPLAVVLLEGDSSDAAAHSGGLMVRASMTGASVVDLREAIDQARDEPRVAYNEDGDDNVLVYAREPVGSHLRTRTVNPSSSEWEVLVSRQSGLKHSASALGGDGQTPLQAGKGRLSEFSVKREGLPQTNYGSYHTVSSVCIDTARHPGLIGLGGSSSFDVFRYEMGEPLSCVTTLPLTSYAYNSEFWATQLAYMSYAEGCIRIFDLDYSAHRIITGTDPTQLLSAGKLHMTSFDGRTAPIVHAGCSKYFVTFDMRAGNSPVLSVQADHQYAWGTAAHVGTPYVFFGGPGGISMADTRVVSSGGGGDVSHAKGINPDDYECRCLRTYRDVLIVGQASGGASFTDCAFVESQMRMPTPDEAAFVLGVSVSGGSNVDFISVDEPTRTVLLQPSMTAEAALVVM